MFVSSHLCMSLDYVFCVRVLYASYKNRFLLLFTIVFCSGTRYICYDCRVIDLLDLNF